MMHCEEEKHPRQGSSVWGIRGGRSRPRREWYWNGSQARQGRGMYCLPQHVSFWEEVEAQGRCVCPISRWHRDDGVSVILRGLHNSYRQIAPPHLAQPFIFRQPTNCLPQINHGSQPCFYLALDLCHTTKTRCVLYYCRVMFIDKPDCGRLVGGFGRLYDY